MAFLGIFGGDDDDEDFCSNQSFSDVSKTCNLSKARRLHGKCPSQERVLPMKDCYKKCLEKEEGTCRGLSTNWGVSTYVKNLENQFRSKFVSQFRDSNGVCRDIVEECGNNKYRSTQNGECTTVTPLITCSDYVKGGNLPILSYSPGKILSNSYKQTTCPNNQCTTDICRDENMTCLEKKNKYMDDDDFVCGGANVRNNLRIPASSNTRDAVRQQLLVSGECCEGQPTCGDYSNRFEDNEKDLRTCGDNEKAIFKNETNCSDHNENRQTCLDHGCKYSPTPERKCEVGTISVDSDDSYNEFQKYCCVKPTCSDYKDGYCSLLDNDGNTLTESDCPANWHKYSPTPIEKTHDPLQNDKRITPSHTEYIEKCNRNKKCGEKTATRNENMEERKRIINSMLGSRTNWCSKFDGNEDSCTKGDGKDYCDWEGDGGRCIYKDSQYQASPTPTPKWLETFLEITQEADSSQGRYCDWLIEDNPLVYRLRQSSPGRTPKYQEYLSGELCKEELNRIRSIGDGGNSGERTDDERVDFCPGSPQRYYSLESSDLEPAQPTAEYKPSECVPIIANTIRDVYENHKTKCKAFSDDRERCIGKTGEMVDYTSEDAVDGKRTFQMCKWRYGLKDKIMYDTGYKYGDYLHRPLNSTPTPESEEEGGGCCRRERCSDRFERVDTSTSPLTIKDGKIKLCHSYFKFAKKDEPGECAVDGCNTDDCCRKLTCGEFKTLFSKLTPGASPIIQPSGSPFPTPMFTCGNTGLHWKPEATISPAPSSSPHFHGFFDKDADFVASEDRINVLTKEIIKSCCGERKCREYENTDPYSCRATNNGRGIFDYTQADQNPTNPINWKESCCVAKGWSCSEVAHVSPTAQCIPPNVPEYYGDNGMDKSTENTLDDFKIKCCAPPPSSLGISSEGTCTAERAQTSQDRKLARIQARFGGVSVEEKDKCWNQCETKKYKLVGEHIEPDGVNEDGRGSSNKNMCRPAFGYKKYDSNFKDIERAKRECSLKMFRRLGECAATPSPSACRAEVLRSRCTVSKNDPDNDSSEPGTCKSFSWDQEKLSTPHYILNASATPFAPTPPKANYNQLPYSFSSDRSVIRGYLYKRATPTPSAFNFDVDSQQYEKSLVDDFKDLVPPSPSPGLKGIVPINFAPSLRAWQGYLPERYTGGYTSSIIEGFTSENNLIEGQALKEMGKDEYGIDQLNSQCFAAKPALLSTSGLKCKDIILDFSSGEANERKTQQCPDNKYYDITKNETVIMKPDNKPVLVPNMVEISEAYTNTCCVDEHKICEKFNLKGGAATARSDYDVTDIFDIFNDGRNIMADNVRLETELPGSESEKERWYRRINSLHGYSQMGKAAETYSDLGDVSNGLQAINEASVRNSVNFQPDERHEGHTVGCWTKCDANYINNRFNERMEKPPGTSPGKRCDSSDTFENVNDAILKCEQLLDNYYDNHMRTEIGEEEEEEDKQILIERKLREAPQCAIFKFPPKLAGYKFKIDTDGNIQPPDQYDPPEPTIAPSQKRNMRDLREKQNIKDLFTDEQTCQGKWLVVTEDDPANPSTLSDAALKNMDDDGLPQYDSSPMREYSGEWNPEPAIDDLISMVNNLNNSYMNDQVDETNYKNKMKKLTKLALHIMLNSGILKKVGENYQVINETENEKLYKSYDKIETALEFYVNANGDVIAPSGATSPVLPVIDSDTNVFNLDRDILGGTLNSFLDEFYPTAKNAKNMFDLRAGPNSLSSIGDRQVSYIFNNRCYLNKKVYLNNDRAVISPTPMAFFSGNEPDFIPPTISTKVKAMDLFHPEKIQPWDDPDNNIHAFDVDEINNYNYREYIQGRFGIHKKYKGLIQSYNGYDKQPHIYTGLGTINNLTHGISENVREKVDGIVTARVEEEFEWNDLDKGGLLKRDDLTESQSQRAVRKNTICKKIIFDLFNPYKGDDEDWEDDAIELYGKLGCDRNTSSLQPPHQGVWIPQSKLTQIKYKTAGYIKNNNNLYPANHPLFGDGDDELPDCKPPNRLKPDRDDSSCLTPDQASGDLDIVNSKAEIELTQDKKYTKRKGLSDLYNREITQCQNISNIFGVSGSYHSFLDHAPCKKDNDKYNLQGYHTIPHRDCFINKHEEKSGAHKDNEAYSAFGQVMKTAREMYGDGIEIEDIDEYWNEHCVGHGLLANDEKPYEHSGISTGVQYEENDPQNGIFSYDIESSFVNGTPGKKFVTFAASPHKKKRPPKHLRTYKSDGSGFEYKDRFGYKSSLFIAFPDRIIHDEIFPLPTPSSTGSFHVIKNKVNNEMRPEPLNGSYEEIDENISKTRRINICRKIRHDAAHKDAAGRFISKLDGKLHALQDEELNYINKDFKGRILGATEARMPISDYLKLPDGTGQESDRSNWLRDGKHLPIPGSNNRYKYPEGDINTSHSTVLGGPRSMPWAKVLRDNENQLLYNRLSDNNSGFNLLQEEHLIKHPHWQYWGENQNIGSVWKYDNKKWWRTDRGIGYDGRGDFDDAPNSQCIVSEPSFTHSGNVKQGSILGRRTSNDDYELIGPDTGDEYTFEANSENTGTSGGTFSCYSGDTVSGQFGNIHKAAPLNENLEPDYIHKGDGINYFVARTGGDFEKIVAGSPFPIGPVGSGDVADGIGRPSDYVGGMREVMFSGERGNTSRGQYGSLNQICTMPDKNAETRESYGDNAYGGYATVDNELKKRCREGEPIDEVCCKAYARSRSLRAPPFTPFIDPLILKLDPMLSHNLPGGCLKLIDDPNHEWSTKRGGRSSGGTGPLERESQHFRDEYRGSPSRRSHLLPVMVFYNNKFNNPAPSPDRELAFGNSITRANGDLRNSLHVHSDGGRPPGWSQYGEIDGYGEGRLAMPTGHIPTCRISAQQHGGVGGEYERRRYNADGTERLPGEMDNVGNDRCSGIEYLKAKRRQFEKVTSTDILSSTWQPSRRPGAALPVEFTYTTGPNTLWGGFGGIDSTTRSQAHITIERKKIEQYPSSLYCNAELEESHKLFKTYPSGALLGSVNYEFAEDDALNAVCAPQQTLNLLGSTPSASRRKITASAERQVYPWYGCNTTDDTKRIDDYGGAIQKSRIRKATPFWFNYFDPNNRAKWYAALKYSGGETDDATPTPIRNSNYQRVVNLFADTKYRTGKDAFITNYARHLDFEVPVTQAPRGGRTEWSGGRANKYTSLNCGGSPIREPSSDITSEFENHGSSDKSWADVKEGFSGKTVKQCLVAGDNIETAPLKSSDGNSGTIVGNLNNMGSQTNYTHPDMIQLMACNNQYGCDAPATDPLNKLWEDLDCSELTDYRSPRNTFITLESSAPNRDFSQPGYGEDDSTAGAGNRITLPETYVKRNNGQSTRIWGPAPCFDNTGDVCKTNGQEGTGDPNLLDDAENRVAGGVGARSQPTYTPIRWTNIRSGP